jgi:hypothetical protein
MTGPQKVESGALRLYRTMLSAWVPLPTLLRKTNRQQDRASMIVGISLGLLDRLGSLDLRHP